MNPLFRIDFSISDSLKIVRKSVLIYETIIMEIGSFLSFADFFFDGPIADYLIQTEIQKTLEDIDDAITHVESIINSIRLQQEVK